MEHLAVSNNYHNIPDELKQIKAWVLWRYEDVGAKKPTKVPYSINGKMASVDDPSTWLTFDNAVSNASKYSGIGFVFTNEDQYTFIDLDDPSLKSDGSINQNHEADLNKQIEIFKKLDSYSEISPSGKGLHIIVKGKVPAGRKRNFIEIYSCLRYATFTGNVYSPKPIAERQDDLMQIWQIMGSGPATYIYNGNTEEKEDDKTIISKASEAANGAKFKDLYAGKWGDYYTSQSEADLALVDIVAFYTQNRNQIIRIFRQSELGKRDKAKRDDYIGYMILKCFDRMLPPLDFDGFKNALELKIAEQQKELPLNGTVAQSVELTAHNRSGEGSIPSSTTITLPPGLTGEIAQFIYAASPRPVPEISLAGAIGLLAGICGRAYNISGTGLNQYTILIAPTGTGKEAMASGIDKLTNAIRFLVPTSVGMIGPSNIASGQALIKHISKTSPCFVSILGEFGLRLQQISAAQASSAERSLKIMLLDLYNKSGHGQVFRPSIYADTDKNTVAVDSPAFSILAESTPSTFFGALNEEMINEGLLPRFMIIEYNGKRPSLNEDHTKVIPPNWLVDKLATLAAQCETLSHNKKVINIATHSTAEEILKKFDKACDAQINNTQNEVLRHMWSRAHMKVLKIAALIAVGVNSIEPVLMPEYVNWAMDMAQRDIEVVIDKFEDGSIGSNSLELRQQAELIKAIKQYYNEKEIVTKYKINQKLYLDRVIPYQFFNRKLMAIAAFRNDRVGATNAIKRTIQTLLDSDKLREVGKNESVLKYATTQRSFVVSDVRLLD